MGLKIILLIGLVFLIGVFVGFILMAGLVNQALPTSEYSAWYSIDSSMSGEPWFMCQGIYQLYDPTAFGCITNSIHNKGMTTMNFQLDSNNVCITQTYTEGCDKEVTVKYTPVKDIKGSK